MDSRKMKRTLFAMIAMFVVLIGVIALTNMDAVMKKLGLVDEQVQETATVEEDTTGGQRGSDLSAFLHDETFFDP